MAGAGLVGELHESILAHGMRLEKIERSAERVAEEWKQYLARDRKDTCAAPDVVDQAVKLMEEQIGRRMDKIEFSSKVNMGLQGLQTLGIVAGLLKAFGVL